jgi:hypothetical protein
MHCFVSQDSIVMASSVRIKEFIGIKGFGSVKYWVEMWVAIRITEIATQSLLMLEWFWMHSKYCYYLQIISMAAIDSIESLFQFLSSTILISSTQCW